jgi:hypothetical protein
MTQASFASRLKRPLLVLLVAAATFLAVDRIGGMVLRHGLDRYFGLDQPEAVLLVGHSHVVLGIDKTMLEERLGLPVANYARAGAALEDRILMVRHYAELHPDGVRAVVFGVDNHLFTTRGLSSNSYTLFYPHMGDPLVRGLIERRAAGRWEILQREVSHLYRYDDVLLNAALRGWMGNWNNSVTGHFNPETLAAEVASGEFRRIAIDPEQVALFEAFLNESEARGWPVFLTFVPTTAEWQNVEPARAAEVDALLRRLADAYPNVTFVDLREPWQHRTGFFIDPLHLNAEGGRAVTADLADRLVPLLQAEAQ